MFARIYMLGGCLALAAAAASAAADRPRNVVLVTIDDLRDVWSYDPAVRTPNLDRLARLGMRFERAYVQATFCNPSRTSFLTGLRPDRTRIVDNRTQFRTELPDVATLPQWFRRHGYYAYRLGKVYHDGERMDDPASWDRAVYPRGTERGERGELWRAPGGEPRWCRSLAAEGGDEDQPDGQIARLAAEFVRSPASEPFFLAVGFHKPHDPFVAPKRYFDMYPLEQLQLHEDPPGRSPTPDRQIGGPWRKAFARFSDRDRRQFLRGYYAGATFMDAQLGDVLDALEMTGRLERTVIVAVSDHGYHLGERGWWNKSTLYEYSTRTPMIIYAPGAAGMGRPCRRIVQFLDIFPTLCDLCGVPVPEHAMGRSLTPLLRDPTAEWDEAAISMIRRGGVMGRALRTPQWRLVQWSDGADTELFDEAADPGEWRNLAGRPEHAETLERLQAELNRRLR